MKVILVNGSPHLDGCTYAALREVEGALKAEGVGTEIFQIGKKPISGCLSCGKCRTLGKCAIDDRVNEFTAVAEGADGFIFGSPVHFAGVSGAISSFMDRVFYSGRRVFYLKPAAAVVSARRAGTASAFDRLNKYFMIAEMPVISSCYWNMVHGLAADDVRQDMEGLLIMRVLGRNMAWFLKCKEAGIRAGVPWPKNEPRVATNFIR